LLVSTVGSENRVYLICWYPRLAVKTGYIWFAGIHGWQWKPGIFDLLVSTVGSENRIYLICWCPRLAVKTGYRLWYPDRRTAAGGSF
jgi:hypothetical protein